MKPNSGTTMWLIGAFVWSIFMGVTAVAIGVGALYPPLNKIAAPFVCPNGQMDFGEFTSNPLPGTTYTQITWYCEDNQTGEKTELEIFPMTLYSGAFYGLFIFGGVIIIWYFQNRRKFSFGRGVDTAPFEPEVQSRYEGLPPNDSAAIFEAAARNGARQKLAGDAVARMKELEELRAANMISESEYEQKRGEILAEL